LTTSSLAAGTHSIAAAYSGDAANTASGLRRCSRPYGR
jgi:hypothetical protein